MQNRILSAVKIDQLSVLAREACRDFDVKRLDVFGSVAKRADEASSDVDLLVEFNRPDTDPARRFFGLLHRLEDVTGSRVDLLTIRSLRNPYFRDRVLREKVPLYEG